LSHWKSSDTGILLALLILVGIFPPPPPPTPPPPPPPPPPAPPPPLLRGPFGNGRPVLSLSISSYNKLKRTIN